MKTVTQHHLNMLQNWKDPFIAQAVMPPPIIDALKVITITKAVHQPARLPPDVLMYIMELLPVNGLLKAGLVCVMNQCAQI